MTLNRFHASYLSDGQPVEYSADVSLHDRASSTVRPRPTTLSVNDPLRLPGCQRLPARARLRADREVHRQIRRTAAPRSRRSCREDPNFTSYRRRRVPGRQHQPDDRTNVDPKTFVKQQVGFAGLLLPDGAVGHAADVSTSVFPAEKNPLLVLTPTVGDLGLDGGMPHSVYSLEPVADRLGRAQGGRRERPAAAAPGPDGEAGRRLERRSSSARRQFATLDDPLRPGPEVRARSARSLLFLGLLFSLTGRRRRIWFRVLPDPSGRRAYVERGFRRWPGPRRIRQLPGRVRIASVNAAGRPGR